MSFSINNIDFDYDPVFLPVPIPEIISSRRDTLMTRDGDTIIPGRSIYFTGGAKKTLTVNLPFVTHEQYNDVIEIMEAGEPVNIYIAYYIHDQIGLRERNYTALFMQGQQPPQVIEGTEDMSWTLNFFVVEN